MKIPRRRGFAFVVALLMVVLLAALAFLMISITNAEIWGAMNYRLMVQARYAAEAGTQETENWMIHSYIPPASITTCTGGVVTNCYTLTTRPVQYTGSIGTAASVVLSGISGVTANYSDSTVQTAFNTALNSQSLPGLSNATYSASATLLAMSAIVGFGGGNNYLQTWQITSQGNITGLRNAQVQIVQVLDRTATAIFADAIFATASTCGAITISGGAMTDSFNSSVGTYAATKQSSNGNVGTNGNLTESGGPTINGSLSTPKTGTGVCGAGAPDALTTSGGSSLTGGVITLPVALTYQTPPAPTPTPPTTSASTSGACGTIAGCTSLGGSSVAFAPGQYGNINTAGGATVHLSAGTYNINSLVMTNGSSLVIDSGPVIINVAGTGISPAVNLTGGTLNNSGGKPSNFQLLYGGTAGLTLSGGAASYGLVYAPNAPITMVGGADWYGSVVGATVNDSNSASVHYDLALQTNAVQMGHYVTTNFSWSKF
jgi:Tfp pilus assembly protein PilX